MKTNCETTKTKSKKVRFIATILSITLMVFVCFFAACTSGKEKETTLNLDNYKTYITIRSIGLGGAGGGSSILVITDVRISRNAGIELDNVEITYIFRANESSQTFSHSLGRLTNEHKQDVHITVEGDFSWGGMSLADVDISIEVTAISGTIVSAPPSQSGNSGEIGGLIFSVVMLVLVIALLLFFIIRAVVFSNKVDSIKGGMSYNEVVQLLGEPKTSATVEDIMTCTWSRVVIRGVFKNHIIIFKSDKVVSVDGHTNFGIE